MARWVEWKFDEEGRRVRGVEGWDGKGGRWDIPVLDLVFAFEFLHHAFVVWEIHLSKVRRAGG